MCLVSEERKWEKEKPGRSEAGKEGLGLVTAGRAWACTWPPVGLKAGGPAAV